MLYLLHYQFTAPSCLYTLASGGDREGECTQCRGGGRAAAGTPAPTARGYVSIRSAPLTCTETPLIPWWMTESKQTIIVLLTLMPALLHAETSQQVTVIVHVSAFSIDAPVCNGTRVWPPARCGQRRAPAWVHLVVQCYHTLAIDTGNIVVAELPPETSFSRAQ